MKIFGRCMCGATDCPSCGSGNCDYDEEDDIDPEDSQRRQEEVWERSDRKRDERREA